MANKYIKADEATQAIFNEILEEHHKELSAVGITFDLLFGYAAKNDDQEIIGNALKVGGFPTNSISSIIDLKNRVKGNADAEVVLDGDTWPKLDEEQKRAVIDRALQHFVVARNIDDAVVLDTHGRPKLKLRKEDWRISLFNVIAQRHGVASPEVDTLKRFTKECANIYFPFMDDMTKKKAIKAKDEA